MSTNARPASSITHLPRGERRVLTALGVSREYWTGLPWQLGSAAYWEELAREGSSELDHRLGSSLAEELGACLLGGFGIPASIGIAAFEALRRLKVFEAVEPATLDLVTLLEAPLDIGERKVRYRFPKQRGERLQRALVWLTQNDQVPSHDLDMREWLRSCPGIGFKTASWIVRNHRSSRDVAIIDIHIRRAGVVAGVFDPDWDVNRDYVIFERAFLTWAEQAALDPTNLDATIWAALARGGSRASADILGTGYSGKELASTWPSRVVSVDARHSLAAS